MAIPVNGLLVQYRGFISGTSGPWVQPTIFFARVGGFLVINKFVTNSSAANLQPSTNMGDTTIKVALNTIKHEVNINIQFTKWSSEWNLQYDACNDILTIKNITGSNEMTAGGYVQYSYTPIFGLKNPKDGISIDNISDCLYGYNQIIYEGSVEDSDRIELQDYTVYLNN